MNDLIAIWQVSQNYILAFRCYFACQKKRNIVCFYLTRTPTSDLKYTGCGLFSAAAGSVIKSCILTNWLLLSPSVFHASITFQRVLCRVRPRNLYDVKWANCYFYEIVQWSQSLFYREVPRKKWDFLQFFVGYLRKHISLFVMWWNIKERIMKQVAWLAVKVSAFEKWVLLRMLKPNSLSLDISTMSWEVKLFSDIEIIHSFEQNIVSSFYLSQFFVTLVSYDVLIPELVFWFIHFSFSVCLLSLRLLQPFNFSLVSFASIFEDWGCVISREIDFVLKICWLAYPHCGEYLLEYTYVQVWIHTCKFESSQYTCKFESSQEDESRI